MPHIVLVSDHLLLPKRSLLAASGKPSTWLPLGDLVEQTMQKQCIDPRNKLKLSNLTIIFVALKKVV